MKTWNEVKTRQHDISGIENPGNWLFEEKNGIWYPSKEIDLFEHPDQLPENLQKLLEKYSEADDYPTLEKMLKAVEEIGYTFDYYLDGTPYDLRLKP